MQPSTAEDTSGVVAPLQNNNDDASDCDGGEDKRNECSGGNGANLRDSACTTVDSRENDDGGVSGAGWFGGMGTDFLNCLTDNVSPVVSGVATLVHKTAVAVANEIAELERDGELEAAAERFENRGNGAAADRVGGMHPSSPSFDSSTGKHSEDLDLPWEIRRYPSQNQAAVGGDEEIPVYVTDTELMKKVLALSGQESTFLRPFSVHSPENHASRDPSIASFSANFVMDEPRVRLTRRLLDMDETLASFHSIATGNDGAGPSDTSFWKNYFFHCEKVRAEEFCRRREKPNETPKTETGSSPGAAENHSNAGNDDDSLVPVGSDAERERSDEDSSYVIQSAPNTADTIATTRSINDDIVLVETRAETRPNQSSKQTGCERTRRDQT